MITTSTSHIDSRIDEVADEATSIEGQVILDGEEYEPEVKSQAEMLRDEVDKHREAAIDRTIEENNIKFNENNEEPTTSLEDIQKQFDDIMAQSGKASQEISSKIQLMDLNEESSDLVADTLLEIESVCNKRSFGDKMIGLLPSPIAKKVRDIKAETSRELLKQKSVAQVAQRHFEILEDKKYTLVDNLESMYLIREKLEQSSGILKNMTGQIDANLTLLNGAKDADSRKNILKGKELMVQVQSQITSQVGLIDQIDTVDFVAQAVVDNINQALPAIKSNFIDQVSITAGLNNLRDLKESVDKTREMTITMSEQTFRESKNVLSQIMDEGIGLSEKDIDRLEKLEKEKSEFRTKVSNQLVNKSKMLDTRIKKLNTMIQNQESTLSNDSLAEVSYEGTEEKAKRRSRNRDRS